jgi:hypothetical protein
MIPDTADRAWPMRRLNRETVTIHLRNTAGTYATAEAHRRPIKIENPFGTPLQELLIGGDPIDEMRRYRGAFLTTQGVPEQPRDRNVRYRTRPVMLDVRSIQAVESFSREHAAVAEPDTVVAV